MFAGLCKFKDCVLFPSLKFHNELVNVVSAAKRRFPLLDFCW